VIAWRNVTAERDAHAAEMIASKDALPQESHHRLKNSLMSISGLLSMQANGETGSAREKIQSAAGPGACGCPALRSPRSERMEANISITWADTWSRAIPGACLGRVGEQPPSAASRAVPVVRRFWSCQPSCLALRRAHRPRRSSLADPTLPSS
jgi:hypothetical protein